MKDGANYRMVYETLKSEILGGKYSIDEPFPSSTALSRRLGLARFTIRQALDLLVQEGLIKSHRGRGTFVTKRATSRKIGLIVPGVAYSEFFPPIVSEISRLAQKEGYTLLFGDVSSKDPVQRAKMAQNLAADFIRQGVAGVLYQPIELIDDVERVNREILSSFDRAKIPVVILDNDFVQAPKRSGYDVVGIDNIAAGILAAEHLIGLNVKRINFQKRPKCSASVNDRLRGVISAIVLHQGGICKNLILVAEPTDVEAVRRHFRKGRPDAVICGNDTAAVELKQSLEKLGYHVPEDVMLVGFDDVKYATIVTPQLTTVRQPCTQIAATAFDRLVQRMTNPGLAPMTFALPVELIVRESTRSGATATRNHKDKTISKKGKSK